MSLVRKTYKQCNHRDDEDELFEVRSDFRTPGRSTEKYCCKFCKEHQAAIVVILLLIAALVISAIILLLVLVPDILSKRNGLMTNEYTDKLNPVAQTNCGAFVGSEDGGAFAFKVI